MDEKYKVRESQQINGEREDQDQNIGELLSLGKSLENTTSPEILLRMQRKGLSEIYVASISSRAEGEPTLGKSRGQHVIDILVDIINNLIRNFGSHSYPLLNEIFMQILSLNLYKDDEITDQTIEILKKTLGKLQVVLSFLSEGELEYLEFIPSLLFSTKLNLLAFPERIVAFLRGIEQYKSEATFTLIVQIDYMIDYTIWGRIRITVAADISESEVCELALSNSWVASFIGDAKVGKVIYVPHLGLVRIVIDIEIEPVTIWRLIQEIEGRQPPGTQEAPIGVRLWSAIQPFVTKPGMLLPRTQQFLDLHPDNITFLETFLTTEKSMSTMAKETHGEWSVSGLRKNLKDTMQQVLPYALPLLPVNIREQFIDAETGAESAMQAVLKSPVKTEATRRKIQDGWKVEKPRQTGKVNKDKKYKIHSETGKKEFSPDHHTHLSEAATRRWQRQRELQATNNDSFEQPAPPPLPHPTRRDRPAG